MWLEIIDSIHVAIMYTTKHRMPSVVTTDSSKRPTTAIKCKLTDDEEGKYLEHILWDLAVQIERPDEVAAARENDDSRRRWAHDYNRRPHEQKAEQRAARPQPLVAVAERVGARYVRVLPSRIGDKEAQLHVAEPP